MSKTKKVAYSVVLTALAVVLSPIFIPVGISKVFPAQHMINVIAGVVVGPWYAMMIAGAAGLIRNLLGTGTIFAFPGGMIGAFLAGYACKFSKNIIIAAVGEVVGTGLIGATVSALVVGPVFLHKSMALATFIVAFSMSTIAGSIIGVIILYLLRKVGVAIE